jgi:hypothetical protein
MNIVNKEGFMNGEIAIKENISKSAVLIIDARKVQMGKSNRKK